jgi:hypothetical protein
VSDEILDDLQAEPARRVVMKAGDQTTVSSNYLTCFADSPDYGATGLSATAGYFLAGDADGDDPFSRDSLAAQVGVGSAWALSGGPSPWQDEVAAISPAWALIQFGTNDLTTTGYDAAAEDYSRNLWALIDEALGQSIIPLLVGPPPRADSAEYGHVAVLFNDVARGMAQHSQIPYVDLQAALASVTGLGLAPDDVTLNASTEGACDFTTSELDFGYNTANKVVLEMLERALSVSTPGHEVVTPIVLEGEGTTDGPFEIPFLPFSDYRTTEQSTQSDYDEYEGCGAVQDESGPEYVYELVLEEETALRIWVATHGGIAAPTSDVDIHLLGSGAATSNCLARNNRLIEGTWPAGTYYVVVDTYVQSMEEQVGYYQLLVSECGEGDTSCDP